jgi:hypothetical protein
MWRGLYILIGFEVLTPVVMKSYIFWDITQCSPLKVNRHFGGICSFHLQGRRVYQARNQRKAGRKQSLAYSSTLNMEATCSSKTSADFQRTTRRYFPEDRTLHNRFEKLKWYNPLKTEFLLNNIWRFSSYITGNTLRLRYKAQTVNAVWGNSRCLLWDPYGTQRYTVWAECRVLVC